jgi:hypothetical protein
MTYIQSAFKQERHIGPRSDQEFEYREIPQGRSEATSRCGNENNIGAPIMLGRCPSLSAHESESMLRTYLVCREKQERGREKQTARERSTQSTNNSDPITSTSELLLRQNSVTAHAHQS